MGVAVVAVAVVGPQRWNEWSSAAYCREQAATILDATILDLLVDGHWYEATACVDGECFRGTDFFYGISNGYPPDGFLPPSGLSIPTRPEMHVTIGSDAVRSAFRPELDPRGRSISLTVTDLETGDVVFEVEDPAVDWIVHEDCAFSSTKFFGHLGST